jgi:hypothetical protein
MRSDVTELIRQLDRGGEITPNDVPWLVKQIADELATLIRLGGAVAATVLRKAREHAYHRRGTIRRRWSRQL